MRHELAQRKRKFGADYQDFSMKIRSTCFSTSLMNPSRKQHRGGGVVALLFVLKQLLGCYYIAVRTAMQNLALGASNVKRYCECQHSLLFLALYGERSQHALPLFRPPPASWGSTQRELIAPHLGI